MQAGPGRSASARAGAGSHGNRSRFCNGMLQMAVAGLPDAGKVDSRFGDAARQVQDIGADCPPRELMRQRLDRGAVHRVHHDRQGQAMAARVWATRALPARVSAGATLGVHPVGGGFTHIWCTPIQCARFGRCWRLALEALNSLLRFGRLRTQLAPKPARRRSIRAVGRCVATRCWRSGRLNTLDVGELVPDDLGHHMVES